MKDIVASNLLKKWVSQRPELKAYQLEQWDSSVETSKHHWHQSLTSRTKHQQATHTENQSHRIEAQLKLNEQFKMKKSTSETPSLWYLRWGAGEAEEGRECGWREGTGRAKTAGTLCRSRGILCLRPGSESPVRSRIPRSTRKSEPLIGQRSSLSFSLPLSNWREGSEIWFTASLQWRKNDWLCQGISFQF